MLTFLNFNKEQLQETLGFQRKINKVASTMGIHEVLYSEIISITASSIDALIIDDKMYFHKVRLYSDIAIKMLNSDFQKIVSSLGLTAEELQDSEISDNFNLIDEITSITSRSMELLNVENSYDLDKLDNASSSDFRVSIESFTYKEIYQVVEPLVRNHIPYLFSFKMINISKNCVEILAITTQCKIHQYTLSFDSCYTRFINRYLSAIVSYDQFKELRKNLKDSDFSKALFDTLDREWDISRFLSFLLTKYQSHVKEKGVGHEGLVNVYNFFMETSVDESTAMDSIRHYFTNVATYEQKKNQK